MQWYMTVWHNLQDVHQSRMQWSSDLGVQLLVLTIPNLLGADYVQKPGKLFVWTLLVRIKVTFVQHSLFHLQSELG